MKRFLATTLLLLIIVINSKAQVEIISSGTGAAYTLSVPGVFSLRNGIQVTFKAHANSSAAATINVSGTGAVSIMKDGGSSSLTAGDIKNGQIVTLAYDGSKWQMMNPVGTPTTPTNYWSPNGSDIFNNNAGNVGIGTTPATKLDVANTTLPTTSRFANTFSSAGSKMAVYGWATGGSTGDNMAGAFDAYNSTGTNFAVYGSASGNFGNKTALYGNATGTGGTNTAGYFSASGGINNYAIIVPSTGGNVGIGTNSPLSASKLHVVGAGNGSTLNVEDNTISNGSLLYLSSTSIVGTGGNNSRAITINRSGANANATHTAYGIQSNITNTGATSTNVAGYFSASGATDNFAIIVPSTGGNVGIGTTSPAQKLEVQDGHILLSNTGTQSELRFKEASANGGQIISFKAPAALGSNVNYTLPDNVGAANDVLTNDGTGTLSWATVSSLANAWSLTGNSGTNIGTNFIGTTDAVDLNFRTNNLLKLRITQKGQLEIYNTGESIFIGQGAGANDDLSNRQNTFIGHQAGELTTSGYWNTVLGYGALSVNTTGNSNTALGRVALSYSTGDNNTATGTYALFWGTSGSGNTGTGAFAGQTITTGSNNTFLGYSADATVNNLTNATAIGYNAKVSQNNALILGNSADVGIGTSTPAKLAGANRYLTIAGTDVGTTNTTGSLEIVGNTGSTNTMASKVDFLGVTPVTNVIIPRARIEARSGNGATLAGQMLFYVNSNGSAANLIERMRIRESGEVGIGNVGVVSSLLSIGASNQFQVSNTGNLIRVNNVPYSWPAANGGGFLSNDGSGNLSWSNAGVLAGGTVNYVPKWSTPNSLSSTSLIYDNGNVVGIGTGASPSSSRLHVHSTSGAGNLRLTSAATLQSATDGFSMSNDGSNIMYMTQHENDDWYFNTNGGTLGIMIKPTGNVGIGTATVNNKLDVEGAAVIGVNYSGTSTAPTNGLLVEGNVGIGTTSSSAKAAIYGSNDPLLLLDAPSGSQSPLVFATGGTNKWAWYLPSGGANLTLWHYGAPSQDYINFDGTNGHVNIAPTTGNVGVGAIATPSEQLEVAGNIEITNSTNEYMINNARALSMNGTQSLYLGDNAAAGSYSTIIGYQAGNVSTGLSNTFVGRQSGLANSSGGQNAFFGINSGAGNTTGQYNTFIGRSAGSANTTGSNNTILGGTADLASGTLTFATAIGYGATIGQSYGMALGGTGANAIEVGIGVNNNMSGKLHVLSSTATYNIAATDYNSAIYGEVTGAIHSSRGIMGVSWATGNFGIGAYGTAGGAALNNYGVYGNATGGTNNYAGYFDAGDVYVANNLGVGIIPIYKLHVEELSTTNLALFTNTTTTGGVGIKADVSLNNATGAATRTGVYGTAWYGTGVNRGGYFYGYGGTTAYGIYATVGGGTTNYAGYFAGDVYTSGSYLPSDEKLKNNIVDYNGALSNVMQLAIKSYSYNQEGDFKKMNLPTGNQVGLIASNMKQLFPSLVKKNSFDFNELDDKGMSVENAQPRMFEFDVVNYAGLVPVLVKAIQEQQEMINNLKREVDSLKNK